MRRVHGLSLRRLSCPVGLTSTPNAPLVYEPTRASCLVLDVRLSIDLPVPVTPIPITSRWDETLAAAGIALERALRAQVPEDFGG